MVETATKLPVKVEKKAAAAVGGGAPWAPFESLRREIDRLFDAVYPGSWNFPLPRPAFQFGLPWAPEASWAISPAVDIAEKEKEYEISAELPGMSEKDIEVKVSNGNLVIKGEKKEEKEEREKDYSLSERRFGSFVRSFALPDGVEASKIEATFANGVLKVKLPKSAEARANEKKIEVKAA